MCVCVYSLSPQGLIQEYVVSGLTAELPGLVVVESGWGLVRCALPIGTRTPPMSAIFKVRGGTNTLTHTHTRTHTHTHVLTHTHTHTATTSIQVNAPPVQDHQDPDDDPA